jgi:hypothetical protein
LGPAALERSMQQIIRMLQGSGAKSSALWDFAAAPIAFRQGRTAEAGQLLKRAARRNPHVIPLIKDPEKVPPVMPETWSPGASSEAVMVADLLGEVWRSDPEVMQWLRGRAGKAATAAGKPKSKSKRQPNPKRKRRR